AKLREPRVFTLEYTMEQTGSRALEQSHRIFRSGANERDETIAVNGNRASRPQVRVFRGRRYRYTVKDLSPRTKAYDFHFIGTRRDGHHLDYVYALRPKMPAAFRFTQVTIDGLAFLPTTVSFATREHGGTGAITFGKRQKWWVVVTATASAQAPGGTAHERMAFYAYRFPPSLPPSTFAVARPLSKLPPTLP
ncbi:MAG TPA: hypothetical protein VE591_11335, partial [Candidatus Acidoferrum sp.]|nr:hypothetical protein [Candidatus Acidoferrum sp.]